MRERFGLRPETEVEFIAENNALRLVPAPNSHRGRKLTKKMRGMATSRMNTDEIMQLTREQSHPCCRIFTLERMPPSLTV